MTFVDSRDCSWFTRSQRK